MNNADTEEQLESTSLSTNRGQRTSSLLRARLNSYEYEGEYFLNSVTATTIEINPEIKKAKELRARLLSVKNSGEQKIILSPIKTVRDSIDMTIDQIIREGTSTVQRERDRERAQARKAGAKGRDDGLTPEQRRERDKNALEEKKAKKAQAGSDGAGGAAENKGGKK
ncbi:hypothetical protein QJS04_geneDACA000755 [Acorus gramineus]|uniref:Small EDRK-rich factor-like N-terminal domain-containing protein n=1 Tax=Acorus gramineus TaxID=55184 RepID=A0AAV9BGS5_ACOGR|nr:hypothetical protein QJS04_geneDACA000755 [Acorus gramineus]